MTDSCVVEATSLTLRRTFNVPRARVFDAWTRPELLKHWWHADPGWFTEIAEFDLREGGQYRLGMRDPAMDAPYVCFGEIQELRAPERLVYTWAWEPPARDTGKSLVTVEFLEHGEITEVVITHERFANEQDAREHSEGWTGCLDALTRLLE